MRADPQPGRAATPRVSPVASALARASTLVLPSGPLRERYRHEHDAELAALDRPHQLTYAPGTLMSAWSLRHALDQRGAMNESKPPTKLFLCRWNIHHAWVRFHNPEGGSYRTCRLCGKDHPSIGNGPNDYLSGAQISR